MRIKTNDKVLVIAGAYKGLKSDVIRSFPESQKIVVRGVNIKKKHIRPKKEGEKGETVEMEAPISVSNVKLICPKCGQAVRVGYKIIDKRKVRICKKCGGEI